MKNIEEHANLIYSKYCEAVGGVAFNGDPLPAWEDFAADPNKQLQSDAWRAAAKESMRSQGEAQELADDLWEMLKESWTAMRSAWNRMDTIREQAPEIYLESDMANLAAPLPHLRNPYTDTDIDEAVMKFRRHNARGHPRRADAEVDQTPSPASDAPPCSISSLPKGVVILIKFMALRMLVGKSHGVDHKDLSTDERELRGTSNPSDGPLWFTQVILLLAINNQPLSESIVSKIDPFRPLPKDYLINWIASMLGDIDTQCAGNSDSINEIVNAIDRYLAVLDQRCDENSSLTILDDVRDDLLPDVGNDGLVKAHNVVFSNSSTNARGHPRREEAEVDQTPSTASDDPPCSLLLKFLFLRMSVEKEILEYSKLSDEEKVLAAQSMFDGRYWPNIVVEEARKSGHPFSDYVVKHVAKIAGGEMSNHNHDQQ